MTVAIVLGLMPVTPGGLPGFSDKLAHGLEFFVLMSWFGGLYSGAARGVAFVGLALLGLAIELAQGLSLFRTFDLGDIAANLVGLVAGWVAVRTFLSGWCQRVEAALA